ncbi:sensor histidine kinase [Streptomyces anandii]|uniref:sensor histidine kinase n=1 Tax=Streptomyces anandii TaxID=285454 RepID=UPI0016749181|nr:histidine kinase [Streptomyces anandii]GGY11615.1 histidine kinase [Streptomyces anandii JCM 4720]
MRGPGSWWRNKTTPAKVETYTRWSFHLFAVLEVPAIGLPAFAQAGTGLAASLAGMVTVHAVACAVTASRALDWTRGRRDQPLALLRALGTLTTVLAMTALVIETHGSPGGRAATAAGGVFAGVVVFGTGTLALGTRSRRRAFAVVAGFAAGSTVAAVSLGLPAAAALVTALLVLVGGGFLAFTSVFSVWLLNAVYELDAARETRARLAVAEERLRFGRDLHDVMGRDLAVIALKAELAVQLGRRGRPEAVEQMIEVQRLAHESQREVRAVVRGYREADLRAELAGAQGVLAAAGIDCSVTGSAPGLPAPVQSALGWVVREATTNVLRHGDARRCAVSLRVTDDLAELCVENDGVPDPPAGDRPGSGLAGLRERLQELDGTLRAGPAGPGRFRLTAGIPLPPPGPRPGVTPGTAVTGAADPNRETSEAAP